MSNDFHADNAPLKTQERSSYKMTEEDIDHWTKSIRVEAETLFAKAKDDIEKNTLEPGQAKKLGLEAELYYKANGLNKVKEHDHEHGQEFGHEKNMPSYLREALKAGDKMKSHVAQIEKQRGDVGLQNVMTAKGHDRGKDSGHSL